MKLTKDAETLISLLNAAGYLAYAVGGCVRDSLLARTVHDIDICTSALPQEAERVFENNSIRYIETGLKHGTVTALMHGTPYEVTTFRTDGDYLDNRRPESVTFLRELAPDLARRDFTVNALAYHPQEGIVDLYGGMEDMDNRILRAVGNADKRFQEDALRIMRALRFSAELGFTVEKETAAALFRNKELLKNIAAERILSELLRLLNGDYCEDVLLEYREVLAVIVPELKPCFDFPQVSRWHIYDVYMHIVKSVAVSPKKDYLRLAMLFHDIAKPQCRTTDDGGQDHFYGHPAAGATIAESVLRRLKSSNELRFRVVTLIENHDYHITLKPSNIKKWLRKLGEELTLDLIDFKIADLSTHNLNLARPEIDNLYDIREKTLSILESGEPYRISDLQIDGRDLIQIGFCKQEIQAELEKLINEVSGNPDCNRREKLLTAAQRDFKSLKKDN